jgi:uncharacterized membrane protein YfcA
MRDRYYRASEVSGLISWQEKLGNIDATASLYLGFAIGVACSIGPVFSNNDPDKWFVAVAAILWFALFIVKFVRSIKHNRKRPAPELLTADDSDVTPYRTSNHLCDTAKD